MTLTYNSRLQPHQRFANEVTGELERCGWLVVPLAERMLSEEHREALLDGSAPDGTARLLRWWPDNLALRPNGVAFLFDVKAALTMERYAYETYLSLSHAGARVLVFLKARHGRDTAKYRFPAEDTVFLDSAAIVHAYADEWQMPLDEDGWIAPRLWPMDKYKAWKSGNPQASGTPFRYVDFAAMDRFCYSRSNGSV